MFFPFACGPPQAVWKKTNRTFLAFRSIETSLSEIHCHCHGYRWSQVCPLPALSPPSIPVSAVAVLPGSASASVIDGHSPPPLPLLRPAAVAVEPAVMLAAAGATFAVVSSCASPDSQQNCSPTASQTGIRLAASDQTNGRMYCT